MFFRGGAEWLARTLCWLATDWNPVCALNFSKGCSLDFFTVRLRGLVLPLTANANSVRLRFAARHCWLLPLLDKHLWPLGSTTRALFRCYSQHQVASVRVTEQQMKLQLLWTAATPSLHPLCISGALETRPISCLQRSSLHLCLPRPPGPARLCGPRWFFRIWVVDHQVVIDR